MSNYTPSAPPQLAGLDVATIWRELQEIRSALETNEVDYIEFKKHNSVPDKPREGRVYYADGTNWDPGSGEGLYIYFASWILVVAKP